MMQSNYVDRRPEWQLSFENKGNIFLSSLDLELTERCNNNCLHCYINRPAEDAAARLKELSTARIKEILKEAVSLGCLIVRFTGGEPLLRQDFEDLYLFSRNLGLRVIIFTNATLITEHLARLFSRIPPLEKIEVSLYGMRKSSYEKVSRIKDSFESAWQGINLLLGKKVPFIVKSVLLSHNKHETAELDNWAQAVLGMSLPPAYSMFFDLHGRRDESKNRLIRKFRVSPEEGLRVMARREDLYLKEMKRFCSQFIGPPGKLLFSCGAGKGPLCVDSYGYLQPCMLLRSADTSYNLENGTIRDALINFFPRIREIGAVNPEYISHCARCFLKGLCEQCPAKSWSEHGTLDTPVEYLCAIAHAQGRFLGILKDGEKAWEVTNWRERVNKMAHSTI